MYTFNQLHMKLGVPSYVNWTKCKPMCPNENTIVKF